MKKTDNPLLRISDPEALQMLSVLAKDDIRQMGPEAAHLIRAEYARRYSTPQPCITVDDALVAHAAASRSVGAVE